jgi:hypothetical protein
MTACKFRLIRKFAGGDTPSIGRTAAPLADKRFGLRFLVNRALPWPPRIF